MTTHINTFIKSVILFFLLIASINLTDLNDHIYYWWLSISTSQEQQNQAIWLPRYQVEQEAVKIEGINNNASGITFSSDSNSLFVIVNQPPQIIELDSEFTLLRKIPLMGFIDPEGIAYAGNGQFIIAEEREQAAVKVNIDNNTQQLVKKHWPSISLDTNGYNNKGFEGVAVNRRNGQIYIVRERDPMRLITISGFLQQHKNIRIKDLGKLNQLQMDDLSALHFDQASGNLLILSDESKLIAEVNQSGEVLSFMDLEAGFNHLRSSIPQAEGITMDGQGNLYIVSEPDLIYRFIKKS